MKMFRLIRSGAADAAFNMALDEAILLNFAEIKVPTLRLYSWSYPSFSFGVFQTIDRQIDPRASGECGVSLVRRPTGGGILFHGRELTYSLICSKQDIGEPKKELISYRKICGFLLRFYRLLGLPADLAIDSRQFYCRKDPPSVICSDSCEKYDILIRSKKIGGNAQKRRKNIILQHGSIPLDIDWSYSRKLLAGFSSRIEDKVTCLSQEMGGVPDAQAVEEYLIGSFEQEFGLRLIEQPLTAAEKDLCFRLEREKYSDLNWHEKRQQLCQAGLAE